MPDDIFRMVVAAAVVLACLAFVVQSAVAVALYRVARKMQARVSALADRAEPVLDKAGPVIDKIGPAVEKAGPILDSVHQILEETRPRIAEISIEAAGLMRTARRQVKRLGELLLDASELAKTRLDQIDNSVTATVEQVEQAGGALKRAALWPVRQVNGITAGLAAMIATLIRGGSKSSVDHATQDEEMFI